MPLDSELAGGVVHRNDTEDGIDYTFECNSGFVMKGSNHVTCQDGVYNGSAPKCLPKGEVNARCVFFSTKENNYVKMLYRWLNPLVCIQILLYASPALCEVLAAVSASYVMRLIFIVL